MLLKILTATRKPSKKAGTRGYSGSSDVRPAGGSKRARKKAIMRHAALAAHALIREHGVDTKYLHSSRTGRV